MSYGYIGSMRTRPGYRDEVASLLARGAEELRDHGCLLYLVGVSDTDEDAIWVTEVWQSREAHDASLELPSARAAIAETMPKLTGEFTRQETTVVGGLGL